MINLLKLWALNSESLAIHDIAECLQLSVKQAARNLKKYEHQGWLTYIPGKGRGNKSKIIWHKNVEKMIEVSLNDPKLTSAILKSIDVEPFPEALVTTIFSSLFFAKNQLPSQLTIPIYNAQLIINPLTVNDTESAWIVYHLFSRLVDEHGEGDLAYHWEQKQGKFIFYIRSNLYWHTGQPMKMQQIVNSLLKSFNHGSYMQYRAKLKGIHYSNQCLIIDYNGPLQELLLVLAQFEFSIQYDGVFSGAFVIKQTEVNQYVLTANPNYHLVKPIICNVMLQTIPSQMARKISSSNVDVLNWMEKREYGGTFYLYYKSEVSKQHEQHLQQFFFHFANEVSILDESKIALQSNTNDIETPLASLKVGYIVNKEKFVDLLRLMGSPLILVDHLTVKDAQNAEKLVDYDCLIVPIYPNLLEYSRDSFETIFTNRFALYDSYRKMYYPKNFIRKGHDLFGYPNLKESYIVEEIT
ncbi:SgrR family transcriptional regulator [Solibacillus sp. MA9]|uniref:SgrR family transcriptional regulator n=1 Tax=Solibacillus palustris TaxID=2908203 RepID=A0ABS9UAI2_9BACL|nr:SgrR family transcriptional regulator [Solibacillus sp. MA9]MCH7321342.1 SgrR family transcriptional regulator [Solibacillus sp. MA9]